jgi:hypothetical protein
MFISKCYKKLNGKTSKDKVKKEDDIVLPNSI